MGAQAQAITRLTSFLFGLVLSFGFITAYGQEKAVPPYHLAGPISHALQKYSGINWLSKKALAQIAALTLKSKVRGRVRVKIETYNFSDLLAGKIKSIEIDLNHSQIRGLSFERLHLYSASPIWLSYLPWQKRNFLNQPIFLKLDAKVSADDIARTMSNQTILGSLKSLKLDLPGLGEQRLQFLEPKVILNANQMIINSTMVTEGAKPDTGVAMKIAGVPQLSGNSRIFVNNLSVESDDIPNPKEFAEFTSVLINPIIDFARFDRNNRAFRLESLKVMDKSIVFSGNLVLAAKPTGKTVAQKAGTK